MADGERCGEARGGKGPKESAAPSCPPPLLPTSRPWNCGPRTPCPGGECRAGGSSGDGTGEVRVPPAWPASSGDDAAGADDGTCGELRGRAAIIAWPKATGAERGECSGVDAERTSGEDGSRRMTGRDVVVVTVSKSLAGSLTTCPPARVSDTDPHMEYPLSPARTWAVRSSGRPHQCG